MKRIFAILLATVMMFSLVACADDIHMYPETLKYVSYQLKDVDKVDYVICVSKQAKDGQKLVDKMNEIIAKEGDDIVKAFKNGVRSTDYNYAGRDLFIALNDFRDEGKEAVRIFAQVYNPYNYSGYGGAYADGIDIIICEKALVEMEKSQTFAERSLSYAYEQVKSGKGDVLLSAIALTEQVKADFLTTNVYNSGFQKVVCMNDLKLDEVKDFAGLTVGVIAGRHSEKVLKEAVENGVLKNKETTIIVYETDTEAKTALMNQHVHAIVMDDLAADYIVDVMNASRQ